MCMYILYVYILMYINAHCQLPICVLRLSPSININFCCHKSNETYICTKFLSSASSICICIHITYIWTNDCVHTHIHTHMGKRIHTHMSWRPFDSSVCDFYCFLSPYFFVFFFIIYVEIWVAWGRKSPGQPATQSAVCKCMRDYKECAKTWIKMWKFFMWVCWEIVKNALTW